MTTESTIPAELNVEISAVEAGLGEYMSWATQELSSSESGQNIDRSLHAAALEITNKGVIRKVVDALPACSTIGAATRLEGMKVDSPRFGIPKSSNTLHTAKQLQLNVVWLEEKRLDVASKRKMVINPFFVIGSRPDPEKPDKEMQLLMMSAPGVKVNPPNEVDAVIINIDTKLMDARNGIVEELLSDESSLGDTDSLIDGATATLAIGYDVPGSFMLTYQAYKPKRKKDKDDQLYCHAIEDINYFNTSQAVHGLSDEAFEGFGVKQTVSRLVATFGVSENVLGMIDESTSPVDQSPDDMYANLLQAPQDELLRICISALGQNEKMRGHLARIQQAVGNTALEQAAQAIDREYPHIV